MGRRMNLNDLHTKLALQATHSHLRGGSGTQLYSVAGRADSCEYELDLADVWLTRSRWTMLTRQYLNQGEVESWLSQIESRLTKPTSHGVVFLRSNKVSPRVTAKGDVTRRWGSCMIGFSFRRFPSPHLVMHSRSTYLGYIGRLDLGVAAKLAELAGKRVGLSPGEIGFTWFIDQATLHTLRSLPWWYSNEAATELLRDPFCGLPSVLGARKHLKRFVGQDKAGVKYGDEPYSTYRQFRMKWHAATKEPEFYQKFLGEGSVKRVVKMTRLTHTTLDELPLEMEDSSDGDIAPDFE